VNLKSIFACCQDRRLRPRLPGTDGSQPKRQSQGFTSISSLNNIGVSRNVPGRFGKRSASRATSCWRGPPPGTPGGEGAALVPRTTDFGLAKSVDPRPGGTDAPCPTLSEMILGTPRYTGSEQAQELAGRVGAAADTSVTTIALDL
jgi:hypothetical protein